MIDSPNGRFKVTSKEGTIYDVSIGYDNNLEKIKHYKKNDDKLIEEVSSVGFTYDSLMSVIENKTLYEGDYDKQIFTGDDLVVLNDSCRYIDNYIKVYSNDDEYLPSEINLEKTNYTVKYKDETFYIVCKRAETLSASRLMKKISDGYYEEFSTITEDTIIEEVFGNVNINDLVGGNNFSFYSHYAGGKVSYGNLISDYKNGLLEPVRDLDLTKTININNGDYLTVQHDGVIHNVIYNGSNVITIGELIGDLDSLDKFNPSNLKEFRHIGLYIFGSTDCEKWGFIGGVERSGKNMRDILTKIERMSVKYIKLVFVGNISDKSHIDSIEMQASRKYNNKIR